MTVEPAGEYSFGDVRDTILSRAKAAGMKYEIEDWSYEGEDSDNKVIVLHLPNGRQTRTLVIEDEERANEIALLDFENYLVLGRFRGIYNKADNWLEVLAQAQSPARMPVRRLLSLPGAEVFRIEPESKALVGGPQLFSEVVAPDGVEPWEYVSRSAEHVWRVPIVGAPNGAEVEFSPASRTFELFLSPQNMARSLAGRMTFKMKNVNYARHDEAVAAVEEAAYSFFFELDLRFDLAYALARTPDPRPFERRPIRESGFEPIHFPRTKYAVPATTLYFYAKSASQNPLLQYLAYYQAMEYFFPSFHNANLLNRVRNSLRDPRFQWSSDRDVQRIVDLIGSSGRSAPEPDQLKATLDGAIDEGELREFLESGSEEAIAFLRKSTSIEGVPGLTLDSSKRLTDQVAERIYSLRCRIVHSKDNYNSAEPLLPYSSDASKLYYDMRIIEFVCRKVIVAGGVART